MRLALVKLAFPFQVPGSAMQQAQVQIRDTDLRDDGAPAGMRYDPETDSVVFGELGGIPWCHVHWWVQIDAQAKCETCGESFRSPSALNGHRRHCQTRKT